jgi:predicted nucleic acid-binding protein
MNLHNAILVDSSGILALVNKKDAFHEAVKPFATTNLLVSTSLCFLT